MILDLEVVLWRWLDDSHDLCSSLVRASLFVLVLAQIPQEEKEDRSCVFMYDS